MLFPLVPRTVIPVGRISTSTVNGMTRAILPNEGKNGLVTRLPASPPLSPHMKFWSPKLAPITLTPSLITIPKSLSVDSLVQSAVIRKFAESEFVNRPAGISGNRYRIVSCTLVTVRSSRLPVTLCDPPG